MCTSMLPCIFEGSILARIGVKTIRCKDCDWDQAKCLSNKKVAEVEIKAEEFHR